MKAEAFMLWAMLAGSGMAVAIKNGNPLWMGLVAGSCVAGVVIGVDLLLMTIPAYRRRRTHD